MTGIEIPPYTFPALFSDRMVRRILSGHKTQTRRLTNGGGPWRSVAKFFGEGRPIRLWVRETWAQVGAFDPPLTIYRANYPDCVPSGYENVPPASEITWRSPIHMPYGAHRLELVVTGVRQEALQDITDQDVVAEGIESMPMALERVRMFRELWDDLHGMKNGCAWADNPLVYATTFKLG